MGSSPWFDRPSGRQEPYQTVNTHEGGRLPPPTLFAPRDCVAATLTRNRRGPGVRGPDRLFYQLVVFILIVIPGREFVLPEWQLPGPASRVLP